MDRIEAFERISDICKDVFENENLVVTEALTSTDVEGWDSLTNLSMINEVEETFDVAFTLDELTEIKSLGELLDVLMKHLEKR